MSGNNNSFQYSAISDHAAAPVVRCEIWRNLEFQEIDKTLIYVRSGIGEDEMFDQEIINDFSMRNSVLKRHEGLKQRDIKNDKLFCIDW